MTDLTTEWIEVRGGLHDAKITSIAEEAQRLIIQISNEWANEDDSQGLKSPGAITLQGAVVLEGDWSLAANGWISEVRMVDTSLLVFEFCDRERLAVRFLRAAWTPQAART